MALTPITDLPAVPLQPTAPTSPTQYNPTFVAGDPVNGNYFTATGRDLMTFYCSPSALASPYSASVNYTPGAVVFQAGSPPNLYIAAASNGPGSTVVTPGTNPSFWAVYSGRSEERRVG